ncbi:MAG: NAD(P)/FAD-dependent oxidoreductase [Clostridia bacterium]|nr:NAD(P)/FAD-dependent oxidoreductase [Clostridia bacterium]
MMCIIVIGGGAAGMMAAYSAAKLNKKVILLEKNEKLGKKIYITGKGRCNLTANVSVPEFLSSVVTNSKFLYGAINTLSPLDLMNLFEDNGLKLKTERGNRVFPESDKASDVTKTLEKVLIKLGVDIRLNTKVTNIIVQDNKVVSVVTDKGSIDCESVVVCTGGVSYPLTGSSGDGYYFAKNLGHSIERIKPALVGIELCGSDFASMQGVSLKNVTLTAKVGDKIIYSDFGEMLFTHFGVSGPIVLSCSSFVNKFQANQVELVIDLKPALNTETLNNRLIKEFKENNTKALNNVLRALLPKALIEVVLKQAKVFVNKNCSEITVEERSRIINVLKGLKFKVKSLRSIDEAIITSGGVSVKEINPKTMESKLVKGLYFAGEVLDVDALTGGYNLQIAWCTGYVAGKYC